MMGALHDDARARGEIAAVLTASESVIYGRFGYGAGHVATRLLDRRAATRSFARPVADPGRVRLVARGEADADLPSGLRPARGAPGRAWSRGPTSGGRRCSGCPRANARCSTRCTRTPTVAPTATSPTRSRASGTAASPNRELLRVGPPGRRTRSTRAALWEFVFGVDLVVKIIATNLPLDEPLRFLLADLAQAAHRLPQRLVVGAAARRRPRCSRRGRTRRRASSSIEVVDPDGSRSRVRARRRSRRRELPSSSAGASPDLIVLACDARRAARSAATSWATLAAAGAVDEHSAGALARADAMFATAPGARDAHAGSESQARISPAQRSMRASQRPGASSSGRVGIISGPSTAG